jgi:uncharacterized membrane protein
MRLGFVAAAIGLALGLAGIATPAQAQLTVCNKAPAPINLAIAYETMQDVLSQGWWTIEPDKCEAVIPNPLNQQYIYHYAKSSQLNVEWAGTYNFCTINAPEFRISGGMDCEARSYRTTEFRQIDLQGASSLHTGCNCRPGGCANGRNPSGRNPSGRRPSGGRASHGGHASHARSRAYSRSRRSCASCSSITVCAKGQRFGYSEHSSSGAGAKLANAGKEGVPRALWCCGQGQCLWAGRGAGNTAFVSGGLPFVFLPLRPMRRWRSGPMRPRQILWCCMVLSHRMHRAPRLRA